MWLLIDDIRDGYGCEVIARDGATGLFLLKKIAFSGLVMDNDLGLESDEGWLILRHALERYIVPKEVHLVTSNPVARDVMAGDLKRFGYKADLSGLIFKKVSK